MKKTGLFIIGLLVTAMVIMGIQDWRAYQDGYREIPGYNGMYKRFEINENAYTEIEYRTPTGIKLNYDKTDLELKETLDEIFGEE